jgi:hypothetical protein
MLLLLAGLAHATPLAPYALAAPGADVSFVVGTERAWLTDHACQSGVCDTVREEAWQGAEVGVQLLKPLGLYGSIAHIHDNVPGAAYVGSGYLLTGGARVGIPLAGSAAIHAWAELGRQRSESLQTADADSATQRWQAEIGAALRGGDPRDGLSAWIGADVVPWSADELHVLDSTYKLKLRPVVPVEAVAGLLITSEPLGGPGTDHARLTATVRGTLGYRTGIAGSLGFVY